MTFTATNYYMRITRRNTLLALGTFAGGVGLIGGTGAFDTVQADRDFDVELDDDASALLQMVQIDEEYVELRGDDNEILEISIGADGSDDENSAGVNDEALTTFTDLFAVGNNGTEDVDVWFETDGVDGVTFINSEGESITGADNSQEVELGDVSENPEDADLVVGLEIDTRSESDETYTGDDSPYTITVHAETDGN
ncbi:hypothetical protein HALLA_02405 (plasmid) [Halostagnicola larsenii XH-48]|uniref:DUF1102 domain-containing protein n=2 Tax=Halostagnicola larsenii TaxID=353800 RepID=W0JRL3_9EURY|nr:hypothetical protein HALLA_02405 [Halostagnicola larsenii XH-48]